MHEERFGTASVTFREYEQKYQQDESPGPGGLGPRYDLEKAGYHTFAGLTIAADTCHGPKGWHLGHTVSVSESSVGCTPAPTTPRPSADPAAHRAGASPCRAIGTAS